MVLQSPTAETDVDAPAVETWRGEGGGGNGMRIMNKQPGYHLTGSCQLLSAPQVSCFSYDNLSSL